MKFVLLVLALFACAPGRTPVFSSPPPTWVRLEPGKVRIATVVGPTLIVNSSSDITAWSPAEACTYREVSSGPKRAIRCPVHSEPLEVDVSSDGTMVAQVLDGSTNPATPVTAPTVIPK
jgi:hypothetical protein